MKIGVLRFTNAEINTNMNGVLLKIKSEIDHPLPPPKIRRGEHTSPV
jgi:very-short-patch-repair endonuclease